MLMECLCTRGEGLRSRWSMQHSLKLAIIIRLMCSFGACA